MGRAIASYNMIQPGDRILVAVSGGKDSLTLLTLLQERKKWVPIKYDLLAAHIQSDYHCQGCLHAKTLTDFFRQGGHQYQIEKINIVKNPDGSRNEISCFWCSWNRRKALFKLAEENKCNKLALGHHKDDIVQTVLLNMFYQANISTMSPKISMFEGKLEIIRPLAHIEEKEITSFARESGFPSQLCKCPNGERSRRRQMGEIVHLLEKDCPEVRNNIYNSLNLKRIKKDYLT